MTQELTVHVEGAAPAPGRRPSRIRWYVLAAALVVAAIVSTATVPNGGTLIGPVPRQPAFALPELDPAVNYTWNTRIFGSEEGESTDATRRLDEALRAVPELSTAVPMRDGEPVPAGGPITVRQERFLFSVPNGPNGTIGVWPAIGRGRPHYHARLNVDGRDGFHDTLTVDLVPKGAYEKGAGDIARIGSSNGGFAPRLVDGCADYTLANWSEPEGPELRTRYECAPFSTIDGLEGLQVRRSRVFADGRLGEQATVVIVYRADGNAIVLESRLAADDGRADLSEGQSRLSGERLKDLALALPRVPVV
ncbi:hypothetical protein Afil01_25770 [Actinorhabdospora filicis]|uniref:Uncharacterized protein n=1 Tax=Actinorhabdospora filicis TaxID=1785913 RepID=A0A9W6SIM4_9ACTN|nr:hypothetical protein [Actinorhabdospora filicis]GLZ77770.1 hypothetical protein Afil01_25770 [Actinorhabdospora filicis]